MTVYDSLFIVNNRLVIEYIDIIGNKLVHF